MKICENRLREIVIEEMLNIKNEEKLRQLYLEAFRQSGVNIALIEGRDWFPIITSGIAIGALAGLMTLQATHSGEVSAASQARAEAAAEKLGSIDTKTSEMEKQLKNMNAWTWTDDEDPQSREMFPTIQFDDVPALDGQRFTVMPPEYSVFLQVMKDKKEGINRYGTPDTMEEVEDLRDDLRTAAGNLEAEKEATQNRIDFTKEFDDPGLYDTLSSEVGIYGVGGQVYIDGKGNLKQAQAIMPDFEALASYYGGPLPLTGLSVEDTYNSFMFGTYLSNDEIEDIEIEIENDTEINPELVKNTSDRATSLN